MYGTITIFEDPIGIINIQQGNSKIVMTANEFNKVIGGLYSFKKMLGIPKAAHAFTVPQFIPQPFNSSSSNSSAYKKWTPKEEAMLKDYYKQGLNIEEIEIKLGRNSGGIRSRLKKLGLIK